MELQFDFSNPQILFFLIPALILITLGFAFAVRKSNTRARIVSAYIIQLVICLLLTFAASGLIITSVNTRVSLMIVADFSDSTATQQAKMKEYIDDVYSLSPSNVDVGVVVFAGNSAYEVPLGSRRASLRPEVTTAATALSQAMFYAADFFPDNAAKRMVILSDGKQTDGDSTGAARTLRGMGIRVDGVYFDTTTKVKEVQVTKVDAPASVIKGKETTVTVLVESNYLTSASLVITDNDKQISTKDVTLEAGKNYIPVVLSLSDSGLHRLGYTIVAGSDGERRNNTQVACIEVANYAEVLIVSRTITEASALRNALSADPAYRATVVIEKDAPKTLIEMCAYDEIVLVNVSSATLPKGFDERLNTYVSVCGKSVLTVGGANTYSKGGFTRSKLGDILPIDTRINPENEQVALILVLDCSSSMTNGGNTAFAMMKEGAIKSVNSLVDTDFVGVVSFNTGAVVRVPLTSASQSEMICQNISMLQSSIGTQFNEALKAAYGQLRDFDSVNRHVIFLSDGIPVDSGYYATTQEMRDNGISVSTIALGPEAREDTLKEMARIGGGTYNKAATNDELPDLMLNMTESTKRNTDINQSIVPKVMTETELVRGIEVPALGGYTLSRLKSGATCVLYTDEAEDFGNAPIYAYWKYGNGTAAAFMSELSGLSGKWSAEWMSKAVGRQLVLGMVDTILPAEHNTSPLDVDIVRGGITSQIRVTAVDAIPGTMTVTITSPGGETNSTELIGSGENEFVCTLPTAEDGVYRLTIRSTAIVGYQEVRTELLTISAALGYSKEYDSFYSDGEVIMSMTARAGGGKLHDGLASLLDIEMEQASNSFDALSVFIIIALCLLVVEIFIRKVRFRDIKNFFMRKK